MIGQARAAPPGVDDRDRDGVADVGDRCPEQVGLPPTGCPPRDDDGDQVLDGVDRCPDLPGPVAGEGCPDMDSDGDLVADRQDRCPAEWGPEHRGGCPGPGGRAEREGLAFLTRAGTPTPDFRAWLVEVAAAARAADARRVTLTLVAEYGLSYGDSLDRARRRALALRPHVAAAVRLPVAAVDIAWRGPDGRPRLEIAYR